ncbi:replication initiator protein [Klebsiella pneumoniae]|nr:replication initiator protein [Klebsiella pneumoniae]SWO94906.1 replication initiator protein [Klebsiella pneumoniae]
MGSCAAPSAKGDDKFITTDYLQQCRIELDLNFDINLNGFLGLDSNVRKGAKSIRVDVHLTSKTASREELEALVSEMQKNSPIHDTLANPVEMITRLA